MEHSVKLNCLNMQMELLNFIEHSVVMEGNRKMRGCLKTFGGHCISLFINNIYNIHLEQIIISMFVKMYYYICIKSSNLTL